MDKKINFEKIIDYILILIIIICLIIKIKTDTPLPNDENMQITDSYYNGAW